MKKRNKISGGNFLVSIPAVPGAYLHSYVACNDRAQVDRVISQMIGMIEKALNAHMSVPIALVTKLNPDGISIVESYLRRNSDEAGKMLDTMTDFHCSTWGTPAVGEDVEVLLALH